MKALWIVVAAGLVCLAGGGCRPQGPVQKPLKWRLWQCFSHDDCTLVAVFFDAESCFMYEQLHWSNCDPAERRAGKLRCELMTEKNLNGFVSKTRCVEAAEGVLTWNDVADGGRWSF